MEARSFLRSERWDESSAASARAALAEECVGADETASSFFAVEDGRRREEGWPRPGYDVAEWLLA